MLRLTGTAACQRLLDLIRPSNRRQVKAWAPSDAENPRCSECGISTILYNGRNGVYFECPRCNATIDSRRQPFKREEEKPPAREKNNTSTRGKADIGHACPRLGCNGRLVKQNGRFGSFLGCSNFPKCREAQDL